MFDKLKFNNLVITNKKLVQKARAQVIAKLVHRLRKLKDALDKQPDNDKHKERLRKNCECMAQLKSFKCLDIMRRMLLQEGTNHTAVLSNGRATPEELALAMLALNKVMQDLVVKFMQSLGLSNKTDAAWRQEILETSKRRAKVERTEEKRRKRKELKAQKEQSRKRLEWLEQNQVEPFESNEAGASESTATSTGDWKVEKLDIPEKVVKEETKDREPKQRSETRKLKQSKLQKNNSSKVMKEVETPKPIIKPDKRVEQLNNNNLKVEKERPTHVIDPFFITETGAPYLSSAVVLSGDSHSESDDEPEKLRPRAGDKRRSTNVAVKQYEHNDKRPRASIDTAQRHPSWLAKQQQKPIISNFKGKKTTFADDGQATDEPVSVTDDSNVGMHPSWIAKQKLKPKIAAFKGTKIKFDDD